LARANDELEAKVALRTAELRVENRAKEIQKQVAENARVEVIRKNEELESSLERERMARQAQDGLFRNTSHELRTPLAVIGGYAEDLVQSLDERGVADLAADARIVLDYQKNMLDLVDQLLDYAKIASGNLLPDIAPFSLNDLIRRLLPIDRLMSKNGNTLKREFTSKPLVLRSDLKRIGQIVLNLVSNAAKFTKKGTITIRIEPDSLRPDHLRIDVADTGIGIRPEEMERIFVPFLQANSRISRDHGGTGLGLSIVRSFVAMLGGSVHVSSVFGQGTTFSVVIPLNCPDDLADRDPSPPDPRPLTTSPSALDAGLVLIIDDDVASRVLLRRQIEEAGLRASEASTGEDGLKMARSLMPAMLCLDVRLPGTEGWNILAELKSDPRTRNIRVIMTTVIEDRRLAATLGADDYLSKPVDRDALDRVLNRFRPDHQPGDVLIVEDEESLRHILARLVERNGWLPRQAGHGGMAMQMVNSKVPDLIFLDLMMPEVDGFEFLAWLRAHPSASTVP
ncbi:MAG: response regulator, partial [Planctomycetes bacterium]|nr:response regulator [Planctomycetota bacterium]